MGASVISWGQRLALGLAVVAVLSGCTPQQRATWQAHSDHYWAMKRLYDAEPKTITTCKPWCFLDYCEYRCATY